MTTTVIAGETPGGPFIVETLDETQDPAERLEFWQAQTDHAEWELYLATYDPEHGGVARLEEATP